MPYVRKHGSQIAIVHGERDPETSQVQQRVLFTLYSRPEADAALGAAPCIRMSLADGAEPVDCCANPSAFLRRLCHAGTRRLPLWRHPL